MRLDHSYVDLEVVLANYSSLEKNHHLKHNWERMSDEDLWEELCLCILSSNVHYELAQSALDHLKLTPLLKVDNILDSMNSEEEIAEELRRSIYLPLKKDGTHRKYRFPKRRAKDIVQAAIGLYSEKNGILELLRREENESAMRSELVNLVSGIGLKQASHFLRNVGYSNNLAIIDTHVIEFLKQILGVATKKPTNVNHNLYLAYEELLIELCSLLGLDLSLFDSVIWRYMRGR